MGPGELEPLRELVQQAAHVRAQFDAGTERLYMLATWPELGAVLALFWPAKLLPQALRSSGREWGVALLATSPALWGCIYLLREIQWCSGGQYCLERWGEVPLNIATF